MENSVPSFKILILELPRDPAAPLLGVHFKELKNRVYQKRVPVFIIVKPENSPGVHKGMNNV